MSLFSLNIKKAILLLSLFTVNAATQAQTALLFDGSTSYVEIPYAAANNTAQFTVEFWARLDGGAGTFRAPLSNRNDSPLKGYNFYARTDNTWSFTGGRGAPVWESLAGPAVVIGQWTHLAATYDGTSYRFYVDGVLVGTSVAVFSPNTSRPMRIGAGNTETTTPNYYFPGAVDEVRIWDYARSESQINDNKYVNLAVPQTGLVSYYQFEDGLEDSKTDSKTGSINGTLMNSPTKVPGVSLTDNADLSALTISAGTLSPTFASGTIAYTASVSNATTSITVTPTKIEANATIQAQVNGGGYATVTSGSASGSLAFNAGSNTVDIKVTAPDGSTIKIYTITVTRDKANPTITNFNDITKTYFDASYTIAAPTSNSTGVFTYTSNNPAVATISGTTVTIVGAGAATITAAQAADATYNSGSITATLTVNSVAVVTKNGEFFATNFNYVNKNGAIGSDFGVNKNGQAIQTKSYDIITNGLVMHLDAGNTSSYPGTGTIWSDLSGNANHGTLINGVAYTSANNGSLTFDGVNDYFVTNNNLDLSSTDKLTIQIVFKTANNSTEMIMEHSVNWNANNAFGVLQNSNKIQITDHNQGYNVRNSVATINDNKWHLLSATTDRSLNATNQTVIYIDGAAPNSEIVPSLASDNSGNFKSDKLYISSRAGTGFYFNGTIAQVFIYNRVLTAEEIQQNYNAVKYKYGL